MTVRGCDIVCVGFADWDAELPTNQHHLMRRLARENRVLFVESLGVRRPQLARRDVVRIARRLRRGLGPPRREGAVEVLSPLVVPLHGSPAVRALNSRLLRRRVARRVRDLRFARPVLWAYVPHAEVLLDTLRPSLVVYHCVDDIAAQKGVDAGSFRAAEARFLLRTDLVLASSPALMDRLQGSARNVVYAPNVADTAFFATTLEPGTVDGALARLPRPRIVFTGAIVATKLDVDLLVELARMRPAWTFALVGPIGSGDPGTDVSPLAAEPNVHLLGPRPYERLPDVLRGADAAFIPYALNALTQSVFPMKVYEYLAAGLPVVATPLPALAGVDGIVTASGAAQVAARLDELLAADSPDARLRRSQRAAGHSWENRLTEISAALGVA